MAKKRKGLIIVLILIVVIMVGTQRKKEYAGDFAEADSFAECEEWRQIDIDANLMCVTPCTYVSPSEKSCLDDCELEEFVSSFYTYYANAVEICQTLYDAAADVACGFDCVYGGLPTTECVPNDWICTTSEGYFAEQQCKSDGTGWNTPVSCEGAPCDDATGRCTGIDICSEGAVPSGGCFCGTDGWFSNGYCCSGIWQSSECLACVDSDGGKDYNIKGTVTTDTQTFTDSCLTDPNLIEYYCDGNNQMQETKDCKEVFGMYGCANGKCVECTLDWHCVAKYEDGYTCTANNLCQLTGNTCADYPSNYGSCSLEGGTTCSSDDKYILSGCSDLDTSATNVYCWTQRTPCGSGNHCIVENLAAKCVSGEPPEEPPVTPPSKDPCGGACLGFVEKCAKDPQGEHVFEGERYDCKISGFIWMLGIFVVFMVIMGTMGKKKK